MQSREEEGWRKSAPVEDRANCSEKPGVEVGSGACIDGSIKKKKKIIRVQLTNKMFQNVTGFKIQESILTGFYSFASTISKQSSVCF